MYWSKGVLPWCEQALRLGVYEALKQEEPVRVKALKERLEVALQGLEAVEVDEKTGADGGS
jgi:hypothetical protein